MGERPDTAKVLASVGCLVWLVPILLVLAALFVVVAIAGGVTGVGAAIFLAGLVAVLVARARRPRA